MLTFQSVVDFTVSTPAVISALYAHLPANGSELVLFDLNRAAAVSPLLRNAAETVLTRILPAPPRKYRTVIITNASPETYEVVEQVNVYAHVFGRHCRRSRVVVAPISSCDGRE